jgi:hypothetical protein
MVRSPNVYHVLCPGRFQIYWAAIDVTVTFEGKLRKNKAASKYFMDKIKSIDEDMLWPEAWKVDVSIKDLTPNNFNLYAEYYQRGFNADEIHSLENVLDFENAVKSLTGYIEDLGKDLSGSVATGLKDGYKAITGKEYEQNKSAGQMLNELKDGGKKMFDPIASAIGGGSVGEKAAEKAAKAAEKAAYESKRDNAKKDWDDILKKYTDDKTRKINYERLYADPRAAERRDAWIKANASFLEYEAIQRGEKKEVASSGARFTALRNVYGAPNINNPDEYNEHFERLGWKR